jgi:hypothetical protein
MTKMLWALLAIGCGGMPAPNEFPILNGGTIYVTPEVSRELGHIWPQAQEAAQAHCDASGLCIELLFGNGANELRLVDSPDALPKGARRVPSDIGRHYNWDVYLFRRNGNGLIRYSETDCAPLENIISPYVVLAHEFGHFLGYSHVDDAGAIMHPVTSCDPERKLTFPR